MTDEAPETFSFTYSDDCAVPCPELSAFLDALNELCQQHGMAFKLESSHSAKITGTSQ
jgi:hypothetical protein